MCWLVVRYCGSRITLGSVGLGKSGQWSAFGMRDPFPLHSLQPMLVGAAYPRNSNSLDLASQKMTHPQPWLNQKHDWPLLHSASVPLVHLQLYGSIQPVIGCLPWLHSGSSASIALRGGGWIIDA